MPGSLPPASEEVKDLNKAPSPRTEDKLASKDILDNISESLTVGKYFNLFQSSSDAADDANLERETLVSVDVSNYGAFSTSLIHQWKQKGSAHRSI